MMEEKVKVMRDIDKNVILLLDEMAIQECVEYNKKTDELVGRVTLPDHSGSATHALVFIVAGLSRRFKQTVAYHFTGASTKGDTLAGIVNDLVQKCNEIGLNVRCVRSDMGSNNQALWREFCIECKKVAHQ